MSTQELIKQVNPVVRGWGHHYKRAHVRKLFHQLDDWLVRRIWSHRFGKWRCCGWTTLPLRRLYGEFGLVNLVALIPSIATQDSVFVKAGCGKPARPVCAADGGQRESNRARLLRPDSRKCAFRTALARPSGQNAQPHGAGPMPANAEGRFQQSTGHASARGRRPDSCDFTAWCAGGPAI